MFYVIVAPGGVVGIDWLWIACGVVIDIICRRPRPRRPRSRRWSGPRLRPRLLAGTPSA
jgi:hypothetical protein